MSELKAFESERIYWAVEQVEQVAGDTETLHLDDSQFYLKSEADKVIAELKKEKEYVIENTAEVINAQEREIRHHKYKRCLAMAWWCSAELGMLVSTWESKIKYYKRWQKHWLELAEKFKEAK